MLDVAIDPIEYKTIKTLYESLINSQNIFFIKGIIKIGVYDARRYRMKYIQQILMNQKFQYSMRK